MIKKQELIRSELARSDASQTVLFPQAVALAAAAIASGFVMLSPDFWEGTSIGRQDWALSIIATVQTCLLAFYCAHLASVILMDYYVRELERAYGATSFEPGQSPMLRSLTSAVLGRHGVFKAPAFTMYVVGFVVIGLVYVIDEVALVRIESQSIAWCTAAVVAGLLCVSSSMVVRASLDGRRLYGEMRARVAVEMRELLVPEQASQPAYRTLGSYLLLPRPIELVMKAIGYHIPACLVGVAFSSISGRPIDAVAVGLQLLLVLVAFEGLIYQARYVWNDWDGKEGEQKGPYAADRGRPDFSGDTGASKRRRCLLTLVVTIGRVACGFGLIVWIVCATRLPARDGLWIVAASGATVLATWAYEIARAKVRVDRLTGELRRVIVWAVVAFGFVTIGYGIRMVLGLELGSAGSLPLPTVLLAAVAGCGIGLAGCFFAWTLRGAAHAQFTADIGWRVHPHIEGSGHLVLLAALLERPSDLLVRTSKLKCVEVDLEDEVVLRRGRQPLNVAWSNWRWPGRWVAALALSLAVLLSTELGAAATGQAGSLPGRMMIAVLAGAVCGFFVSTGPRAILRDGDSERHGSVPDARFDSWRAYPELMPSAVSVLAASVCLGGLVWWLVAVGGPAAAVLALPAVLGAATIAGSVNQTYSGFVAPVRAALVAVDRSKWAVKAVVSELSR